MLIQPEGEGLPLFCVQGDQANRNIPRHLGPTRPFYAFRHQGGDGRRILLDRVETIAEHSILEMRAVRPRGPYLMCGYSFGGVIAYEMAQQLLAIGEEVPLLALFDTYAPSLHAEAVRHSFRFYEPVKAAVMRTLMERRWAKGSTVSGRLRHFHIIETYLNAVAKYTVLPYPGKLTVFKAEGSWGPVDLGWHAHARGGLDLQALPGDHNTIVNEPHVGVLAEELRHRLEFVEAAWTNAVP
ncbi:MAG: hypothetical protein IPL52_04635 [Flavobacteriales bacterium]|nr:hypothetical protein [Flavobacteriales bacterium]